MRRTRAYINTYQSSCTRGTCDVKLHTRNNILYIDDPQNGYTVQELMFQSSYSAISASSRSTRGRETAVKSASQLAYSSRRFPITFVVSTTEDFLLALAEARFVDSRSTATSASNYMQTCYISIHCSYSQTKYLP